MKISLKKERKKSAIVSMGTRISLDSNNVRSVDLIYLRKYLQNVLNREVDYVSLKIKKDYDNNRNYFKNISEVNLNDYDEVWIYNHSLNAFGGLIKLEAIQTFDQLCSFNGDIFYFLIDPKLPCTNIANYIKGKLDNDNNVPVSGDQDFYHIDKSKLDIYTNNVWPRIITAFDGNDFETFYNKYNNKHKTQQLSNINWCELKLAEYYSIQERLELKLRDYPYNNKKYDLIYYGNNRSTDRNNLIKKLYDHNDFNVHIIGYDPKFENSNTDISKYVDHDKLFPLIGESYASVICGDNLHNGNIKTVRFFECMLLDTVAFIHNSYDPEHKYIKDKELADFMYIDTYEDIKERLDKIKNNEDFYRKIVCAQRKEIMNHFS